ncbi:MAG: hypothetical protein U1F66_13380 [bacterium]
MKRLFRALAVLTCFSTLFAACSGGGTPVPTATGLLYVLDRITKTVYVYDNIGTINGAVDPVRTISGDNTLIQNPTALAVDTLRDILYVSESTGEQVLVFTPASTKDGNIAPLRTYPGLTKGAGLYYDLDNDVLYAADSVDRSIKAWDGVSQLATGASFTRRIGLNYQPSALFVDTQRDLLYVGDPATATINVYASASTLGTNNPSPTTSIQDSTQAFVDINSITVNVPNNFLFVGEDFNPSVEIFEKASTLNGAVPTDRSLEGGSTGLTLDMGQVIFLQNVLYVQLSRTQIGVWDNANSVTGDDAPDRNLTINPAQQILGFAIDLAH